MILVLNFQEEIDKNNLFILKERCHFLTLTRKKTLHVTMEKISQNFKVRDEDGLGLSIIFNPPKVSHAVSLPRKSPYFQGFLSKQPSELRFVSLWLTVDLPAFDEN